MCQPSGPRRAGSGGTSTRMLRPGRWPGGARATAGGDASVSGLANGGLPGWRSPSGAVPHLRAAAGCTGVMPRGGAPPVLWAGERAACGGHRRERPARGVVCLASASCGAPRLGRPWRALRPPERGDVVACGAARAGHRHDGGEVTRPTLHSARWSHRVRPHPCAAVQTRRWSFTWARRGGRGVAARPANLNANALTSTLMR